MKLEKAIEMLSLTPITGDNALDKDMSDAMKLGREALKRMPSYRLRLHELRPRLLPGETEE